METRNTARDVETDTLKLDLTGLLGADRVFHLGCDPEIQDALIEANCTKVGSETT